MLRIIIDCELNPECVKWLEELVKEEEGSQNVSGSFLKVIDNALKGRLKDMISLEIASNEKGYPICSAQLKAEFVQGLQLLRMRNHGTEFPKTFLKVIWHQLLENKRESINSSIKPPSITAFQEEIVLSSYIKDLNMEVVVDEEYQKMPGSVEDLQCTIKNILQGTFDNANENFSVTSNDDNHSSDLFDVETYFYVNLENRDVNVESCISQDFDNIGLSDSDHGSEITLSDDINTKLPLTLESLKNLKVSLLPSRDLDGVWETLHYESNVKQKLYGHTTLSLQLSNILKDRNTKITKNNLFLLHGPPGTGKTTLCKALCQKLAVRTSNIFDTNYSAIFIELSCSKIFSRWFGESTKNLDGIFHDIELLLRYHSNSQRFVCLLLDEVESLAFSRTQLLNKNETTDSVRVLNCLMSHMDNLKTYPNFILLCTSNLRNNIDAAFLDRLDVSIYVSYPSIRVCKEILLNLVQDMIDSNVVSLDRNKSHLEKILHEMAIHAHVCLLENCLKFELARLRPLLT